MKIQNTVAIRLKIKVYKRYQQRDRTEKGVEEKVEEAAPVDAPDAGSEDDIPAPVVIEEQESTPDIFERMDEEPQEQVVFKR